MTLQVCVLSPLHTESSIFPSSSALDHVTTKEKKKCCHVCVLSWQRRIHIALKSQNFASATTFFCPCCYLQRIFIKSIVHFGTVAHSGEQILLQVVFLTPCVHDHVTTPTRGWWKITSLQATGKWMVLAVYHIIQPNSEPAWHGHCHISLYFAFKSSKAFTESIKWIQLLNCISFTPPIIRTFTNAM